MKKIKVANQLLIPVRSTLSSDSIEEHRERVTAIIQATTGDIIIVGYGKIGGDWEPLILEAWFHKISI